MVSGLRQVEGNAGGFMQQEGCCYMSRNWIVPDLQLEDGQSTDFTLQLAVGC